MRIVGGIHRGRQFSPGKNFKVRPTTDMAKESLFNILMNRLNFEESKALDLFAGTGSISLELVSRGCQQVTAIELNFQHYTFIKSIVDKLGESKHLNVIKANVFQFCKKTPDKFDFIFADPPYDHKQFHEVPDLILSNNILNDDGLFILEHPKQFNFSNHVYFRETRHYGSVHFSFFKK